MPGVTEMAWIAAIALLVALLAIYLANNVDAVGDLVGDGGFFGFFK